MKNGNPTGIYKPVGLLTFTVPFLTWINADFHCTWNEILCSP